MSQHDFNISNQTASATRADLNNALGALASLSSGTTAPTTTYANMLWYETDTNWLWVRNEADSAWVRALYFNQSTNKSSVLDDTQIVTTSGNQTGILGDQTTATWQAGTGTLDSLVSPANVKAAILALTPSSVPTTAQVATATAGIAAGAVGSYIWGRRTVSTSATIDFGGTIAGSEFRPAGFAVGNTISGNFSGSVPSGTWRCMGYMRGDASDSGNLKYGTTLLLRIS